MVAAPRTPPTPSAHTADIVARARALAASINEQSSNHLDPAPTAYHATAARVFARDDREFWQHRPYNAGDAINRIDWRASARTDETLVRDLQRHDDYGLSLWLDPRTGMHFTGSSGRLDKFSTGLVATLALASHFKHRGVHLSHLNLPALSHQTALDDLAALYFSTSASAPALPDPDLFTRGGGALIITDGWDDMATLGPWLLAVTARVKKCAFLHLADPFELSLPQSGRARFTWGPLTTPLVENIDSVRTDYQSRITNHLHSIKETLSAHNGYFITTPTTDNLRTPCTGILDYLSRGIG
jgi:Protein of unknown function DUF58